MARKENIEQQVEKIVLELLEGQSEIEMVDVEYVKERDWYLRVFIDKEGGIEIDDCQALSEKLEERLDAEDFITDSYILEVSSPGKEKELTGVLTGSDEASITLDGELQLPLEKVAQIRLHIDF